MKSVAVIVVEMSTQIPRDVAALEYLQQCLAITHTQGEVADGNRLCTTACDGKRKHTPMFLHLLFYFTEKRGRGKAVETHPIGHS